MSAFFMGVGAFIAAMGVFSWCLTLANPKHPKAPDVSGAGIILVMIGAALMIAVYAARAVSA